MKEIFQFTFTLLIAAMTIAVVVSLSGHIILRIRDWYLNKYNNPDNYGPKKDQERSSDMD
jgi:hypothetical protein